MVAFRDHLGESEPTDDEMRAGVERLLGDPDTEFLLAAPDGDGDGAPPPGVAQLRFRFGVWRAGGDCLLEDLYVDESARGAGLGHALVEGTPDGAPAPGRTRAGRHVNESKTAAPPRRGRRKRIHRGGPAAVRELRLQRHVEHVRRARPLHARAHRLMASTV